MRALRAILAIFIITTISACAYGPTQEQLNAANYGTEPDQSYVEQAAKDFFQTALKDPESARYSFSPVYKGWLYSDRLDGSRLFPGYVLDVQVNSKNSYGGYAGWSSYRFIFSNGSITRVVSISPQGVTRKIY